MHTILIADDEEDLRTIVRMTLEDPQVRILEAEDGDSTVELARTEYPDVLILDWMMPGRSGLEVVHALQQQPETSKIRVIFLTAKDRTSDQGEGLATGAFAYLVKPFSPLELLEKVQEALPRSTG